MRQCTICGRRGTLQFLRVDTLRPPGNAEGSFAVMCRASKACERRRPKRRRPRKAKK